MVGALGNRDEVAAVDELDVSVPECPFRADRRRAAGGDRERCSRPAGRSREAADRQADTECRGSSGGRRRGRAGEADAGLPGQTR